MESFQFAVSQSASNSIQSIFIIPSGVIFCAASGQQAQQHMHTSSRRRSEITELQPIAIYSRATLKP